MIINISRFKKRQLAVVVMVALFLTSLSVPSNVAVSKAATEVSNPRVSNSVTTWDCIWFGNYWQEDTNGDGKADKNDEKTPIKWRVLSVNGNDAFLVANQNLDCQPYNTTNTDVTWETCTLRTWLNDTFLNNAFSSAEQQIVKTAAVVNDDNPYNGTGGGNNTSDKVYLLSIDEVGNTDYGFDSDKTREAKNTAYAKECGAWTSTSTKYEGNGGWWLRSPGSSSGSAALVYSTGYRSTYGYSVNSTSRAVRPALHLNLSSSLWKYAGTVTSDGGADEEATPMPGDEATSTPEVTHKLRSPNADLSGGIYDEIQQITLSAEEGADIYYTTDGTEPSAANGTRYTEPVKVDKSCTLKAIAVMGGMTDSDIMVEQYTILDTRDKVTIDDYTIYVTDTTGEPLYDARVVIGTDSGRTDRDGKCEFSSIKGRKDQNGAVTFDVTVQSGGYTDYAGYDCSVNENHVTYIMMMTVSEEDASETSLLKNHCFESVLWKDALLGNIDLMVNQKTISLSEPDSTFELTVNIKPDAKEYVKGYSLLSGNKKVSTSKDGVFDELKYSMFEADKKVYIELDIDQGSDEIKRAATERQQINLMVKNPGESVKNVYGSLSLGENLTFSVSDDIPFIGGTKFNLAKLNLPIDMKFSTNGEFILTVNTDEEELYKTKNGILFKDYDEEAIEKGKKKEVVDDTFFGLIKDAVASSSENLAKGEDDKAFKAVEMKFSDSFTFSTKIGGYISGNLNDSVKKGTGSLYLVAKAEYKGEMQTIVYTVPIVLGFEIGATGKVNATLKADFSDLTKEIGECIEGELLFNLNPYVKVGVGPGCKELNVKIKGGFELPIDYYMLGNKKGLQSIRLKADAAVSGKVFGLEKEWEFWNDELNVYTREEQGMLNRYLSSIMAGETSFPLFPIEKSGDAGAAESTSAPKAETVVGGLPVDYSDVASNRSWNEVSLSGDSGSQTLNDRVSGYTNTRTVMVGDTPLMVYSDVDTERDSYNADTLYYSVYNRDSGEWSKPQQVDANTTADFGFDLYSDGETAYLVYQEMNRQITGLDSVEDMAQCTRIVYTKFDSVNGKFTDCYNITDDGHYVMQPSIVTNQGNITVGWIENSQNDYYALNDTNQLIARTCSNGVWSEPKILLQDSNKICELEGCVLDSKTYLAYIVDGDNKLDTVNDRNVYMTDLDGVVTNVAQDEKMDANLEYSSIAGETALYWYRGDRIVSIRSALGSPTELVEELTINPNEDFRVISDGEVNQAIVFSHNDSVSNEGVVEAYIMYRQSDGGFTYPVRVTEDGQSVSGLSGVLFDGKAMINYRQDHYNSISDAIVCRSSLCSRLIDDFSKVLVDNLDFEYDEMQKGAGLVMTADVTNAGNHRISELQANVISPSGEDVGTYTVSVSLDAGKTDTLMIPIRVPEQLEAGEYILSMKESGVDEAESGSGTFSLLYSELKIKAEQITLGENLYLSAVVENRGDLDTEATVCVVNQEDPENVCATAEVETIAAGGYQVVRIPVTSEMLSEGAVYSDFTLSVKADQVERYQYDNTTMVQVGSRVKGLSLNHESLDLKVNEAQTLSVTLDALGTPEFIYEWISSDESIAKVDQSGTVKALSEGEAVITVMTKQGDFAECRVVINKEAEPAVTEVPIPEQTRKPEKPAVTENPQVTTSPMPTTTVKPGATPETSAVPTVSPIATSTPTPENIASPEPEETERPQATTSPMPTTTAKPSATPSENPLVSAKPSTAPIVTSIPNASPEIKPTIPPVVQPSSAPVAGTPTVNPPIPTPAAPSLLPTEKVKVPSAVKATKVKTTKKNTATVTWKKESGVAGYQIQYSLNKKFKPKSTKWSKSAKITLKKLKKGKTYYVRIRAYRLDGSKKVYGKWGSVKKVKVK